MMYTIIPKLIYHECNLGFLSIFCPKFLYNFSGSMFYKFMIFLPIWHDFHLKEVHQQQVTAFAWVYDFFD